MFLNTNNNWRKETSATAGSQVWAEIKIKLYLMNTTDVITIKTVYNLYNLFTKKKTSIIKMHCEIGSTTASISFSRCWQFCTDVSNSVENTEIKSQMKNVTDAEVRRLGEQRTEDSSHKQQMVEINHVAETRRGRGDAKQVK